MRISNLFFMTQREDPSDAEVPSHRLLVRGGYIRRAAPGGFTWLPLGWNVYRNVENIVREEMDRAGFQEVHFPALLPREPYEATGRWADYGDNLFRLKDRRGNDFLLAPTHEEMFTLLVKDLYSSYKDLPVSLYQIQTKYRDEARPRAGLLRGREFLMKDSYSFDMDEAGLQKSYDDHRAAYERIFTRLGLPFVIVKAMSGAMGGSASEEFLAPIEVGEDTFVRCTKCDYAANTEAVAAGAVPFAVQGPENAWCRDGGRTIGWELALQYEVAQSTREHPALLDRLFVQVGGGALASCAWSGAADQANVPTLHAVQAEGCAPLVRAWQRANSLAGGVAAAGAHWRECMVPWESEPASLADGILDDETYDWIGVLDGMADTGGSPVVASEEHIVEAHRLARELTDINVSPTGSAGLATSR